MVLLSDPETILDPLGEHVTGHGINAVIMTLQGWEHLKASTCILNLNGLVMRPQDDFGPIGQECDGINPIIMASHRLEHLDASACIPNLHGIVIRP